MLDALTETEKQLVLKVAEGLAEDACRITQSNMRDVFLLQDPHQNANDVSDMERLEDYQEFVQRAIPKTINWSALYTIKQGPSKTPSEFLEHLQDAMHRCTTFDPESEEGIQHLEGLLDANFRRYRVRQREI